MCIYSFFMANCYLYIIFVKNSYKYYIIEFKNI